jgi:FAD/FMN-containing dehydrogenase
MGGAMGRVPEDATAFGGRHAGYTFNIIGNAYDSSGFEEERQWARDYWAALSPYHRGVYVNFLMDEGTDRTRQAYGEAKLERLTALKTRYDPTNLFRLNQNIPPADG